MSYVRWSSDDFQSDLYIYEDASGGWTTHVAGNRVVWNEGVLPEPLTDEADSMAWFDRHVEVMKLLGDVFVEDHEHYHREDIDLPHAGEHFNDPTPGACADRVEALLALGYRCPSEVVTALRAEQAELDER